MAAAGQSRSSRATKEAARRPPHRTGDLSVIETQLSLLVRRARGHAVDVARSEHADLDPAVSAVLLAVADGTSRAADLAGHFGVDKAAISRQLRVLEDRGLVRRTVDVVDARAWRVALTPSGATVVKHLLSARRRATRALLAGWSAEDIGTLADGLTRLNDSLAR